MSVLSAEYTIVTPDLLARGESSVRDGLRYRLSDEVRRVHEVSDLLMMDRFLIVGHSAGASIALGMARVTSAAAGLVLVNPVTPWSRRPRLLDVPGLRHSRLVAAGMTRFRKPITRYILERRVLGRASRADPALIDRYSESYSEKERTRALLAVLVDWQPAELTEWLPDRPVPAIVMTGEMDSRMPVGETSRLAERIGAPHVTVPRAGHSLPDERPAAIAEAIREIGGSLDLPSYTLPDGGLTSA